MPAYRIGFIGAGHMNSAIIRGLLNGESSVQAAQLMVSAKTPASAKRAGEAFAITATTDNRELIANAKYLVIGVKPQQLHPLLLELSAYDLSESVIITLAAGIRLADYRKLLGDEVTLVRAMPNVAACYQAGLTGIYSDDKLDSEDEQIVEEIFTGVGSTAWLDDETQIDGITALSGSGIAYLFRLMQAMAQVGQSYGFEADELYDLIALTALGAGTMALENEDEKPSFDKFVKQIAVEGGTTAEAMRIFAENRLDDTVAQAMQAVIDRSQTLSETLTKDW